MHEAIAPPHPLDKTVLDCMIKEFGIVPRNSAIVVEEQSESAMLNDS
jgi:hypothetical protein